VRDDPTVVVLANRPARGDLAAWNETVERHAPLVRGICTRFQLSNHDREDGWQNLWLLLVEQTPSWPS
jgi:DNA-directed RNA polymerase specialized sigma24 family protein